MAKIIKTKHKKLLLINKLSISLFNIDVYIIFQKNIIKIDNIYKIN
jgi:hypothetical protein